MADVSIRNLTKRYNDKQTVLNAINLEIRSGEFIVLVGPSGCGKSTLLRTIAGLEEATSGEILIDGKAVNDLPPGAREIAMVFQDYALYPHMTVRENLEFGLRLRRTPKKEMEGQVAFAAEILGLKALLERKPSELSGGQRQRVAIGRAITRKPKLFLFDEPLSNLDAQLRMQTRVEIAALHRRLGATSIYVTHDQTEAMTLADRIVLLNRGVVQQIGPPLELYRKPANQFVARFLGTPGMNLLSGRLETNGSFAAGAVRLPTGSFRAPMPQNGRAVLGVRPEGVRLAKGESECDALLPLIAVEPLGHETLLALDAGGGEPFLLRSTGDEWMAARSAERVPIRIERDAVQWFQDSEFGQRIE